MGRCMCVWWGRGVRMMAVPENHYLQIMVCNGNLGFSITSSVNIACINEKQYFILPKWVRDHRAKLLLCLHTKCACCIRHPVQAPFSLTNNQESNNKRIELVDGLEHANLTLHYIVLFHLLSTYSLFSSVYVRI